MNRMERLAGFQPLPGRVVPSSNLPCPQGSRLRGMFVVLVVVEGGGGGSGGCLVKAGCVTLVGRASTGLALLAALWVAEVPPIGKLPLA